MILKSDKKETEDHNNQIDSNDCDGDYYHRGGSAPRRCEELEVSEAELVLFQEKTVFLTFVPKSVIFFIRCDKKTKTQKSV